MMRNNNRASTNNPTTSSLLSTTLPAPQLFLFKGEVESLFLQIIIGKIAEQALDELYLKEIEKNSTLLNRFEQGSFIIIILLLLIK
jgi:hypothetical protein